MRVSAELALVAAVALAATAACLGSAPPDQRCDPGSARLKAIQQDPVLNARPPATTVVSTQSSDPAPDGFHNCQGPRVTVEYSTADLSGTAAALQAAAAGAGWANPTALPSKSGTIVRYEKQFGGWPGQLFISTDPAKNHAFVELRGAPAVSSV